MTLNFAAVIRKSILLMSVISISSSHAESPTTAIRAYCKSPSPIEGELLNAGDVLDKFGKPKHKVEYEVSRKEVWIYSGLAVEFRAGLPRSVKCRSAADEADLQKQKLPPVVVEDGLGGKIEKEATPQNSAGFTEALSELTKTSPDQVEAGGPQAVPNASVPILRPLGTPGTPPSFPQVTTPKD